MKALLISTIMLTVLTANSAVQAKPKEVSFRNKKDNSFKLYCTKNPGRLQTTIRCDDKLFTPDADWEEITAEKVCFQHDDGRILPCDEISKLDGTKKRYVYFFDKEQKQKHFLFTPGDEWKLLPDSDDLCGQEREQHSDVIRYTEMPSLDIDW